VLCLGKLLLPGRPDGLRASALTVVGAGSSTVRSGHPRYGCGVQKNGRIGSRRAACSGRDEAAAALAQGGVAAFLEAEPCRPRAEESQPLATQGARHWPRPTRSNGKINRAGARPRQRGTFKDPRRSALAIVDHQRACPVRLGEVDVPGEGVPSGAGGARRSPPACPGPVTCPCRSPADRDEHVGARQSRSMTVSRPSLGGVRQAARSGAGADRGPVDGGPSPVGGPRSPQRAELDVVGDG